MNNHATKCHIDETYNIILLAMNNKSDELDPRLILLLIRNANVEKVPHT